MNKSFLELKDVYPAVVFKNILSNITFSLKKGEILTIIGHGIWKNLNFKGNCRLDKA